MSLLHFQKIQHIILGVPRVFSVFGIVSKFALRSANSLTNILPRYYTRNNIPSCMSEKKNLGKQFRKVIQFLIYFMDFLMDNLRKDLYKTGVYTLDYVYLSTLMDIYSRIMSLRKRGLDE